MPKKKVQSEVKVESVAKAEKKPKQPRVTVKLLSFEVGAVIPTQQYGNIQPKIVVSAESIEEARAAVMPIIEDLYLTYAEAPLNGKPVAFTRRVDVEVKQVVATEPAAPVVTAPVETPAPTPAPEPAAAAVPTSAAVERPAPFKKAEAAINAAGSHNALGLIQEQIERSVKIEEGMKPELYQMIVVRRNQIPF